MFEVRGSPTEVAVMIGSRGYDIKWPDKTSHGKVISFIAEKKYGSAELWVVDTVLFFKDRTCLRTLTGPKGPNDEEWGVW